MTMATQEPDDSSQDARPAPKVYRPAATPDSLVYLDGSSERVELSPETMAELEAALRKLAEDPSWKHKIKVSPNSSFSLKEPPEEKTT